jgi:hypothetical protein
MYIFSVNAKAKKARDGVKEGQLVPFIVYINFIDLFGAEQLCKVYLMRAGFTEIDIEKRKLVPSNLTGDPRVIAADMMINLYKLSKPYSYWCCIFYL